MADLFIRLQPGARHDRVDGWARDAEGREVLQIRLRARPVEGEANAALVRFLAESAGLPKSSVALARGDRSRLKRLTVQGVDDLELRARLNAVMAER
ncbi:DUF167 domain-containing protein [Brevundimonas sp. VNH65]|uniref:DUF167 domain-containing protein n=1 Tax=Brevundimonas sp. VNH65 TaxID=3400917 RepID=UPI003BFED6C9